MLLNSSGGSDDWRLAWFQELPDSDRRAILACLINSSEENLSGVSLRAVMDYVERSERVTAPDGG